MSGGKFSYDQYRIRTMWETIQSEIDRSGRKKTKDELKEESWRDPDWYEKYPEDLFHYKYSDETIEEFKTAVLILKTAEIYANRVDYLLSGDDGEETFHERLNEELNKLI